MTFLHSVVSIRMGWIMAAAIAGTTLVVLWIATLLSRRWYITIRKSEETEVLHYYLRRIAESLERLAAARESRTESSVDAGDARPVGTSLLGH
jgi:hypothetical protein